MRGRKKKGLHSEGETGAFMEERWPRGKNCLLRCLVMGEMGEMVPPNIILEDSQVPVHPPPP